MTAIEKNIDVIHNCEERFYNWLKVHLSENGMYRQEQSNLSGILENYETELSTFRQHLKPLLRWNKIKEECYTLTTRLNGQADNDDYLRGLIEKTAFEGQILWLTFQEE
jgi:hypothetical protein